MKAALTPPERGKVTLSGSWGGRLSGRHWNLILCPSQTASGPVLRKRRPANATLDPNSPTTVAIASVGGERRSH